MIESRLSEALLPVDICLEPIGLARRSHVLRPLMRSVKAPVRLASIYLSLCCSRPRLTRRSPSYPAARAPSSALAVRSRPVMRHENTRVRVVGAVLPVGPIAASSLHSDTPLRSPRNAALRL